MVSIDIHVESDLPNIYFLHSGLMISYLWALKAAQANAHAGKT